MRWGRLSFLALLAATGSSASTSSSSEGGLTVEPVALVGRQLIVVPAPAPPRRTLADILAELLR